MHLDNVCTLRASAYHRSNAQVPLVLLYDDLPNSQRCQTAYAYASDAFYNAKKKERK